MPRRFLIDENVPRSVSSFLQARGHEVMYALDLFLPGEKDQVLAAVADQQEALIVTWNHLREVEQVEKYLADRAQQRAEVREQNEQRNDPSGIRARLLARKPKRP